MRSSVSRSPVIMPSMKKRATCGEALSSALTPEYFEKAISAATSAAAIAASRQ